MAVAQLVELRLVVTAASGSKFGLLDAADFPANQRFKSSAISKGASAKSNAASAKTANKDGGKRLSPGALDGLVFGHMKRNRGKLPATSGVVSREIKRSSGAVANCLERLEKAGKVKLTNKKPREYDLVSAGK